MLCVLKQGQFEIQAPAWPEPGCGGPNLLGEEPPILLRMHTPAPTPGPPRSCLLSTVGGGRIQRLPTPVLRKPSQETGCRLHGMSQTCSVCRHFSGIHVPLAVCHRP